MYPPFSSGKFHPALVWLCFRDRAVYEATSEWQPRAMASPETGEKKIREMGEVTAERQEKLTNCDDTKTNNSFNCFGNIHSH